MISRAALITALVLVEGAIVCEMVFAVRGGPPDLWPAGPGDAALAATSPNLVEGAPKRSFDAGAHPALRVDIGNADLTIRTNDANAFGVAVSKSTDFGMFRATAPIQARLEDGTMQIDLADRDEWSAGDDRMVTLDVPATTKIDVVHAGDIRADGLRAEASFVTGSGKIRVEDYAAPTLHAETSGGRISLVDVAATRLEVSTDDGRIEGNGLTVRDGSIASDDGRVSLGFSGGADTIVKAEAENAKVRVEGLPAAQPATDASQRTVRLGNGDGRLDVRSSDGDIDLSQS